MQAKPIIFSIVSSLIAFAGGYAVALHDEQAGAVTADEIRASASRPSDNPRRSAGKPDIDDTNLAAELSEANEKIARLQRLNSSLSRQIEQMDLPLPTSTTYPELLHKIDRLPASFINQQLTSYFGEEYVSRIEDPYEFSKQVVEMVLDDQSDEIPDGSVSIEFSQSPISGVRQLSQTVELDQYDTVFAHVTATQDVANCIAKWQHVNTGEVLLLRQLDLKATRSSQYVWVKPSLGWQPGSYALTIHDMDNDKQLIASSSLQVANVLTDRANGEQNKADNDVIQDLLLSGQATPKMAH
jgi:hypothetical protein